MKKAFTLIEVMVVLSILAIIAILAYNFFGSTMKEANLKQAVTDITKAVNVLETAYTQYDMDNSPAHPATFNKDLLVSGGYIKSLPQKPSGFDGTLDAFCPDGYNIIGNFVDVSGDGWGDILIVYGGLNNDLCMSLNDYYRGDTTIPTGNPAKPMTAPLCFDRINADRNCFIAAISFTDN